MKVLYVTHYSGFYGANRSLLYLLLKNKESGIQPLVLIPERGEFTDVLEEKNVEYIIIPFKTWVSVNRSKLKKYIIYIWNNFFLFFTLYVLIREKEIDIVHTNSSATNVGALIAKKLKKPHVWHIREFLDTDYNLKFDFGYEKATEFINNNSKVIIAISKEVMNKYINSFDARKFKLIYNGIEEKEIVSKKIQNEYEKDKEFNLLIVGYLIEGKGHDHAIEALNIIHLAGFNNVKLIIVGDGPLKEKLEYRVSEFNLKKYVEFKGYVSSQEELNKIRIESDISLICSVAEAFGRTTIEAMLAKLPVVASNSGATPEILQDNESGIFYKPITCEDLAKKIIYLMLDVDLRKTISDYAYNIAIQKYTAQKNASKIIDIYKELIKTNIEIR